MLEKWTCGLGLKEGEPFFQQGVFDAGQNPVKGWGEIGRAHESSEQGTQGLGTLRSTFPL